MIGQSESGEAKIEIQNFYFQLHPIKMVLEESKKENMQNTQSEQKSSKPTTAPTYQFLIFKRLDQQNFQKIDENKQATSKKLFQQNQNQVQYFKNCQLNFYIANYKQTQKHRYNFVLKLVTKFNFQSQNSEIQNQVFFHMFNPVEYVKAFKQSQKQRFLENINIEFEQKYQLQYEVYVDNTRFKLEKVVRHYEQQREKYYSQQYKNQGLAQKQAVKQSQNLSKLDYQRMVEQGFKNLLPLKNKQQ